MFRLTIIFAISFLNTSNVRAEYSKDSTQSNIINRIVSAIARKCHLNDSTKKELSNHFYSLYLNLKKLKNEEEDKLIFFSKLYPLKKNFLEGLRKKFGEEVYRSYKKLTSGCTDGQIRQKKLLNRITER